MARRQTPEDRSALRQAMVEHAEKMIVRGGLEKLTARALAKEMNIAIGTTYNLFENLDELVYLVNLRTLERLQLALEETIPPQQDVEQVIMDYANRYIGFVEDNAQLWSAVFQMRQIALSAEARQQVSTKIAHLFGHIEDALAPLVADADLRRESARSLWAAVHGILSMSGGEYPTLTGIDDMHATIHHLVHCHLAGLQAG